MKRATIGVTGEADRLLRDGLEELRPLFEELGAGVIVIGGLMARIWLHLRPIDVPARAMADVDLGADRRALRLSADRRVLAPLLERLEFEPRLGDEEFRFVKQIDGRPFPVDLGVAPGSSRADPPLVEKGMATVAVPGLAFALRRRTVVEVGFVEEGKVGRFELPLPRRCARIARRADVRAATGWLRDSFPSTGAAAARRVQEHFAEEAGVGTGGEWAVRTAARFAEVLGG